MRPVPRPQAGVQVEDANRTVGPLVHQLGLGKRVDPPTVGFRVHDEFHRRVFRRFHEVVVHDGLVLTRGKEVGGALTGQTGYGLALGLVEGAEDVFGLAEVPKKDLAVGRPADGQTAAAVDVVDGPVVW